MRAVLRFLGSRWFLSFVGVALLGVLVWLFGPFLAFLEDWIPRAAVIAVMVLIWAGREFLARSPPPRRTRPRWSRASPRPRPTRAPPHRPRKSRRCARS